MVVGVLTEGGPRVGYGHLSRSVALCEVLRAEGAEIRVTCRGDGGGFLERFGFGGCAVEGPAALAGCSWVVVDGCRPFDPDRAWALAPRARLCLIDHPGPARLAAALVVDPPTGVAFGPAGGARLGGLEHVLLREEFREAEPGPRRGGPVLVTLGGADPAELSARVARALARRGLPVRVVAGKAFERPVRFDGDLVIDPARMAPLFQGASLVVCGFGHTLFEAARMGVPAAFVSWRSQHVREAAGFERFGFALHAGRADAGDAVDSVAALARDILEDRVRWTAMSRAGSSTVDGLGAPRVAAAMRRISELPWEAG